MGESLGRRSIVVILMRPKIQQQRILVWNARALRDPGNLLEQPRPLPRQVLLLAPHPAPETGIAGGHIDHRLARRPRRPLVSLTNKLRENMANPQGMSCSVGAAQILRGAAELTELTSNAAVGLADWPVSVIRCTAHICPRWRPPGFGSSAWPRAIVPA